MKHMKRIYRIGYYDEECGNGWELWHEKKLTEEELSDLMAKAIINVIENNMDEIADWCVNSFGIGVAISKPTIDDILMVKDDEFLEEVKKLGFEIVEYTSNWMVHGSYGLFEGDRWELPEHHPEAVELRKKIPKELKDRVMAKVQEKKEERERRKEMSETQKKIEVKK